MILQKKQSNVKVDCVKDDYTAKPVTVIVKAGCVKDDSTARSIMCKGTTHGVSSVPCVVEGRFKSTYQLTL